MMLERQLAELLEGTTDAAFAVDLQEEVRTWNTNFDMKLERACHPKPLLERGNWVATRHTSRN
jgi:hypothetical protein